MANRTSTLLRKNLLLGCYWCKELVDYTFTVHFVAYSNYEHFVHFGNMARPPTPPRPRERTVSLCIQYEDVSYVLKAGLIHLLPKFHGFAGEDPNGSKH
ncbi:hypothetical protein Lal_00038032 [Lupinus albus]|nr:hypothetical protein Lal_00038032 [Lupinus albus]